MRYIKYVVGCKKFHTIFNVSFQEEIPYCSHVRIDGFKDIHDELSTVDATICVSRKSQKLIIEGHNKWTLNKLRSLAKKKLEVVCIMPYPQTAIYLFV